MRIVQSPIGARLNKRAARCDHVASSTRARDVMMRSGRQNVSTVYPPVSGSQIRLLQPIQLDDGADRPLLLYLAGMDGTGQAILAQMPGLMEAGLDVRCLYVPPEDRSNWDQLVAQTCHLLSQALATTSAASPTGHDSNTPARRAVIVGESFGGCLGLRVAAAAPQLLQRLVLVNPATSFSESLGGLPALVSATNLLSLFPDQLYAIAQGVMLPLLVDGERAGDIGKEAMKSMMTMTPLPEMQAVPGLPASPTRRGAGLSSAAAQATNWRSTLLRIGAIDDATLATIATPTLVVVGARDRLFPSLAEGARLQRVMPNARRLILPDSAHALLLERSVDLAAIMASTGFLPEAPPAAGVPRSTTMELLRPLIRRSAEMRDGSGGTGAAADTGRGAAASSATTSTPQRQRSPAAAAAAERLAARRPPGWTPRAAPAAPSRPPAPGGSSTVLPSTSTSSSSLNGGAANGVKPGMPSVGTSMGGAAAASPGVNGTAALPLGANGTAAAAAAAEMEPPPLQAAASAPPLQQTQAAAPSASRLPDGPASTLPAAASAQPATVQGSQSSTPRPPLASPWSEPGSPSGAHSSLPQQQEAGTRGEAAVGRAAAADGAAAALPAPVSRATGPVNLGVTGSSWDSWSQILVPWRELISPVVLGAENLPDVGGKAAGRPVLFVGNHGKFGLYDTPLLVLELYLRGFQVKGLAHPDHWLGPTGQFFEQFGAVKASPMAAYRLLKGGEQLLLFPGGAREVHKRKGEDYQLFWKDTPDFVRLAAKTRAIIVPFAAVGADDAYDVALDPEEVMEHPVLGPLVTSALQQTGSSLEPLDAVPPLPKFPGTALPSLLPLPNLQRLYFKFMPVVDTALTAAVGVSRRQAGPSADEAAAVVLYEDVRRSVEQGLRELLELRSIDQEAQVGARLQRAAAQWFPALNMVQRLMPKNAGETNR